MTEEDRFADTFEGILDLVERLRRPDGCPWDREQTRSSLRAGFLEECYELADAIDAGAPEAIMEELGDVALHLAFQLRIAEEAGEFVRSDVFGALKEKLVRCHPHVFGDARVADSREVVAQWREIKQRERSGVDRSILADVLKSTPGLARSQAIQERAARAGFDWEDVSGVLEKVAEEVSELAEAASERERERELGDLLFSLVNLGRWLGVDAEAALHGANDRFNHRFVRMEQVCRERGLAFADLPMDRKEALWQEAKRSEG